MKRFLAITTTSFAAGAFLLMGSGAASATTHLTRSAVETFSLSSSHGNPVYQATAEGNLFFGDGTFTELTTGPDPSFLADIANGTFMVATFGGQSSSSVSRKSCTASLTIVNMLYTIYQGTGALQGLRGTGNATVHVTVKYGSKAGSCLFTKAAVSSNVTVLATGPVSLPSHDFVRESSR